MQTRELRCLSLPFKIDRDNRAGHFALIPLDTGFCSLFGTLTVKCDAGPFLQRKLLSKDQKRAHYYNPCYLFENTQVSILSLTA